MATLFVGLISRYSIRETLFLAFTWQPKGTVTATLGSVIYDFVATKVPDTDPLKDEYT